MVLVLAKTKNASGRNLTTVLKETEMSELKPQTIKEIQNRKEDQTFDCKSIQIEPKALAVPIVAFANADGGVIEIEGIDRMCRELEATGAPELSFRTDGFILKISVPNVAEKVAEKLPEKRVHLIDKIIDRAKSNGDKLSKNKITILKLMLENPYISKSDIAETINISYTAVNSNIKAMRGKYLRRVGPDKGGFWEIII